MSTTIEATPTTTTSEEQRFFIEGMDCADCANKVERAVCALPGASNVRVNFNSQILSLTLDEARTPAADLVRNVRALGYTARPPVAALEPPTPWYRTTKGRLVILTGALLAIATLLERVGIPHAEYVYAVATLIAVAPLARKAWAAARSGSPFDINTLVSVAAVGAVIIGEAAEGSLVVFLFLIGELLEGVAAGRARQSIQALAAVTPKTALLLEGDQAREVPAESLVVGDLVRVVPGARVPADGEIVSGESAVDESPITGESVPVHKGPGQGVFAGAINTDGGLVLRVTAAASDNTIARIIHLVTEAEAGKSPTARFIDRFSRWYTPLVLVASAATAILPPLLGFGTWGEWIYKGLALLLIGCPCALVLSTPAAVTSAISAGARRGLLFKGGEALEHLAKIRRVAFDKTGTLTRGEPQVTDIVPLNGSDAREVLRLAAAVESASAHPLAAAIVRHARAEGETIGAVEEARAVAGKAVIGTVAGRALAVGSPRYAAELGALPENLDRHIARLEGEGKTTVVLLDGTRPLGLIALRDEPREDAAAAIAALTRLGVGSVMLTGDNARTANAIAGDLGLESRAELLPADKLTAIRALQETGPVAMVGDGINDAPALATATVGIAMGAGTDVALETASAALLRNSIAGVVEMIGLARATMRTIYWNIGLALGLKAIILVTTLLGITNLWFAILSDTGATALVTLNALRLLGFGQRRD